MNFYSKKILIVIFLNNIYGEPEKKQTLSEAFITRIQNKTSNKIIGLTYLTSLVVGGLCLKKQISSSYIAIGIGLQIPILLHISKKNSENYGNFKKQYKCFNWLSEICNSLMSYFLIKEIVSHPKIIEYINENPWKTSAILSSSSLLIHILGAWIEEYYYYKKYHNNKFIP